MLVVSARQARSAVRRCITVAVAVALRVLLARVVLVAAVQVIRQLERLELRIQVVAAVVAVRLLAVLVARVAQESPSSLTPEHNARPAARSPVQAA